MRGPIFLSCRDSLFCFLSDGTKNVLLYDTVFPLEFLFPSIIKIKYTFIEDFVDGHYQDLGLTDTLDIEEVTPESTSHGCISVTSLHYTVIVWGLFYTECFLVS